MNTNKDFTIDVVIPVYNGAAFIRQALDSVNQQTLSPRSIIVVDDGSTDGTSEILKAYSSRVPLKYIRQENHGLSFARNAGWRASSAALIAFLDADDVWRPEKLAQQLTLFQSSDSDQQLVYTGYHLINEHGQPITPKHLPVIQPRLRGNVFEQLLTFNTLSGSGSAVLVPRQALEQVGGFDESLPALEDWDMWLRLARLGRIDFVDQDLVGIRTRAHSMQQDTERMTVGTLKFFSTWLERLPPETAVPRTWIKTIARLAGSTWPPGRFNRLLRAHLSPTAYSRLSHYAWRHMTLYTLLRLASLPVEWLVRRPWRSRRL